MLQRLKVIGIVLFVIIDLIAIGLTLRHVAGYSDAKHTSVPLPAGETASAEPTKKAPKIPSATGLAMAGETVARFSPGSCVGQDSPLLEVSVDKAATFAEVALPVEAKADANGNQASAVTRILTVKLTSSTKFSLVADGLDCKPAQFSTTDGGKSWNRATSISDWYVDGGKLKAPDSVSDPGCDVLSISAISKSDPRVVCQGGQILRTGDGGRTWTQLGVLADVSAASFGSLPNGYGIAKNSDCSSRAYQTADGGQTWRPAGCIDRAERASAVAGGAGFLCALVRGDVFVSANDGSSWKKA